MLWTYFAPQGQARNWVDCEGSRTRAGGLKNCEPGGHWVFTKLNVKYHELGHEWRDCADKVGHNRKGQGNWTTVIDNIVILVFAVIWFSPALRGACRTRLRIWDEQACPNRDALMQLQVQIKMQGGKFKLRGKYVVFHKIFGLMGWWHGMLGKSVDKLCLKVNQTGGC